MSELSKAPRFRRYLATYARSLKKPVKNLTPDEVGAAEQQFLDEEQLMELLARLLPYLREERKKKDDPLQRSAPAAVNVHRRSAPIRRNRMAP